MKQGVAQAGPRHPRRPMKRILTRSPSTWTTFASPSWNLSNELKAEAAKAHESLAQIGDAAGGRGEIALALFNGSSLRRIGTVAWWHLETCSFQVATYTAKRPHSTTVRTRLQRPQSCRIISVLSDNLGSTLRASPEVTKSVTGGCHPPKPTIPK
jgi:hypothetical protein